MLNKDILFEIALATPYPHLKTVYRLNKTIYDILRTEHFWFTKAIRDTRTNIEEISELWSQKPHLSPRYRYLRISAYHYIYHKESEKFISPYEIAVHAAKHNDTELLDYELSIIVLYYRNNHNQDMNEELCDRLLELGKFEAIEYLISNINYELIKLRYLLVAGNRELALKASRGSDVLFEQEEVIASLMLGRFDPNVYTTIERDFYRNAYCSNLNENREPLFIRLASRILANDKKDANEICEQITEIARGDQLSVHLLAEAINNTKLDVTPFLIKLLPLLDGIIKYSLLSGLYSTHKCYKLILESIKEPSAHCLYQFYFDFNGARMIIERAKVIDGTSETICPELSFLINGEDDSDS